MMKRREFDNREEAGKFFYGISKMAEVAYKSYNVEAGKYVVEWKWDKKILREKQIRSSAKAQSATTCNTKARVKQTTNKRQTHKQKE